MPLWDFVSQERINMEKEYFLAGYCRINDQSRTVSAEFADGSLTFTDCNYPDCPYADRCTVAGELQALEEKEAENV